MHLRLAYFRYVLIDRQHRSSRLLESIWPLYLIGCVALSLQISERIHTWHFWLLLGLNSGLCHRDWRLLRLPHVI